jgi:hypothetical protein
MSLRVIAIAREERMSARELLTQLLDYLDYIEEQAKNVNPRA